MTEKYSSIYLCAKFLTNLVLLGNYFAWHLKVPIISKRKSRYPLFQCRNYIKLKPNQDMTVIDVESTSSDSEPEETPLGELKFKTDWFFKFCLSNLSIFNVITFHLGTKNCWNGYFKFSVAKKKSKSKKKKHKKSEKKKRKKEKKSKKRR